MIFDIYIYKCGACAPRAQQLPAIAITFAAASARERAQVTPRATGGVRARSRPVLFLFPPAAAHQVTRSREQLRTPARSHATALATAESSLVQSLMDWHAQCASSVNISLPAIKNHFVLSYSPELQFIVAPLCFSFPVFPSTGIIVSRSARAHTVVTPTLQTEKLSKYSINHRSTVNVRPPPKKQDPARVRQDGRVTGYLLRNTGHAIEHQSLPSSTPRRPPRNRAAKQQSNEQQSDEQQSDEQHSAEKESDEERNDEQQRDNEEQRSIQGTAEQQSDHVDDSNTSESSDGLNDMIIARSLDRTFHDAESFRDDHEVRREGVIAEQRSTDNSEQSTPPQLAGASDLQADSSN